MNITAIPVKSKSVFISFVAIFWWCFSYAQPTNDQCRYAIKLPNASDYCSKDAEFTNIGATPDPEFALGNQQCIGLKWQNGVWFSFVPKQPAVLIKVFGFGQGGTLKSPKIILFESCNDYLSCSPGKDIGIDEFLQDNLIIGKTYFIMVESSTGGEGTFKLCVDDFIPVPQPESDCSKAVVLCDKSPFVVESLQGAGSNRNEIEPGNCIFEEFQSSWYKWTCDQSGSLTFTLTPNNHRGRDFVSDDLDFALYELPGGLNDCGNKKLVRCMASGANIGPNGQPEPLSLWVGCNGPTGLRQGETDITETAGCSQGDNNFVRPLDMEAGKSYVLIVNNFSKSGIGFSIEFGGSGTFLGPKVDFEIQSQNAFECDKTITFINKSESLTDPIKSYVWNFGNRSNPGRAQGVGPYDVVYESFGDKTAALVVETTRGCRVTKILDFFVEPCCKDTSTLTLDGLITDLRCYKIPEGSVEAKVIRGGSPEFEFSIDGKNYQSNPLFPNLNEGTYELFVVDTKGCRHDTTVVVNGPPPIIIDAGESQVINLGDFTNIQGVVIQSVNGVKNATWSPPEDVIDFREIDYFATVFPKNETVYVFTITDENGCIQTDTLVIRVKKNYALHAPNVIKTGRGVAVNNFFNIFGNNAIKFVERLEIYDRWGNMVYQGVDERVGETSLATFKFGSYTDGWDGQFMGKDVEQGVYAWRALVRYIDDETRNYAGDLTVIRE